MKSRCTDLNKFHARIALLEGKIVTATAVLVTARLFISLMNLPDIKSELISQIDKILTLLVAWPSFPVD